MLQKVLATNVTEGAQNATEGVAMLQALLED